MASRRRRGRWLSKWCRRCSRDRACREFRSWSSRSPGDVAERVVTKSAFCAARQKLNPTAFIELNRHLVQRWYHDAPVRRWRGFDLRAIDGSTLRLPDTPEAIARFGQTFPAHSDPATLARISQVYDPLNGLILDAIIAPYQRDERELLVEHLAALEAGSLLLLDCGYPAFWVFAALQTRKLGWCARVALDTQCHKDNSPLTNRAGAESMHVGVVQQRVARMCVWRKGRLVSMLRISPSCRTNTMLTVATTLRGRSDA